MGTEIRQTTGFEVDLMPPNEHHRCYLCKFAARPSFTVWSRRGSFGLIACFAHVASLMDDWDNQSATQAEWGGVS